ncbi:MAG: hypothetical protein HY865_17280 [Chloroflexi bacterium]|nr:hypothetical protein [Chloroflexota bacterium]
MIDGDSRKRFHEGMKRIIEAELTPQGDLLPPWIRYPQIPRYSIGWRMGGGESYMWAWDSWVEDMKQEQRVEYFKRYLPIPFRWIDWVADRLGFPNVSHAVFSGQGSIEDVHWLEEQGLVNFSEFKDWFDSLPTGKKRHRDL